jgi:glycosyltransferase involved in cell wall biosynthesis
LSDSKLRVAIVADFAEEGWPSMDLVADALFDRLRTEHADEVEAVLMRPRFKRRFTRWSSATKRDPGSAVSDLPLTNLTKALFNADRLLNRFIDYPRRLRRVRHEFEVFHIIDHSYAHLVHQVEARRAIVTCHDLDAFRSVIEPSANGRGRLLKMMAARELSGLQSAAMVPCDSEATRDELLRHRLVAADRTAIIPNGVAPYYSPQPDAQADRKTELMLGPVPESVLEGIRVNAAAPEILHVGSTISRKRIDVLLRVFAGIRKNFEGARLVRVSGPFTAEQTVLARELNVSDAISVLPFVEPDVLAAIYRRAALVLITSDQEGFGLPLIEAMACGAPVIASDLAVLREVGGHAAEFVAVGNVPAWISAALRILREQGDDPAGRSLRRSNGFKHAAKFSWSEYARRYVELYRQVASA